MLKNRRKIDKYCPLQITIIVIYLVNNNYLPQTLYYIILYYRTTYE